MSDEKPQKVSIGFAGGSAVSTRVAPATLKELRGALSGGGWYDLVAEDATIALQLDKVVYVLADTESHRVGFGG